MRGRKLSLILLIVILALFAWYFYANANDFKVLLHASPFFLALVLLGHLVSILTNGFFIKAIFEANHKEMTVKQSVIASFISAIGNFFFPIGTGTAAQAKYLKSNHQFNYKNFLSALSGNYIIVFLVNGIFGLISVVLLRSRAEGAVFYTLLIIFAGMFLPNLYFALYGIPVGLVNRLERSKAGIVRRVGGVLGDIIKGWNFVTSHRGVIYKLIAVTALNFLASMLISFAAVDAIGLHIGLWALVLYSALGAVTLILNITPGSIGIREAVFIFTSSLIGLSTPQILVVAIIDRISRFIILLFGLVLFKDYFNKNKPTKSEGEQVSLV